MFHYAIYNALLPQEKYAHATIKRARIYEEGNEALLGAIAQPSATILKMPLSPKIIRASHGRISPLMLVYLCQKSLILSPLECVLLDRKSVV